MYSILVPVDDNEERAEMQINTIESLPPIDDKVEAHVLYVYEEVETPGEGDGFASAYLDDVNASLDELRDLPETVETTVDALEDLGAAVTVHELVGDPADAILSTAEDVDADVVMMGVRDRSPIGKVVFGSVSQKVILGSEVPVIVAR
ncbi:universal stress protein [Halanaeroarchaeum sulfurireducens]|uniref:UspA domain-containing protein n=1 Tax=Halanaeroarchaeum sulfurireducens TaxID=1604004 RepID=A0A0F7P769_9EURY|nr:universal stress protein [Halanaeroarchaeum sulfurireducens]AKH96547.1 UspA domain-containing protein [Halanaeroarchaeum sulfurireducens]ALG80949.1 UspA domain-containing protein [Halanaeroarchaeum sulfurireducens]